MNTSELREQLAENQLLVNRANALHRLQGNSDFKEVILTGLLHDRVLELVEGLANLEQDSPVYKSMWRELDSLSYLSSLFKSIAQDGTHAKETILEINRHINEED